MFLFSVKCSLCNIIKWFAASNLVLNLDKMNITNSCQKIHDIDSLHIDYKEKSVEETVNTGFLGSQIYNNPNWKNHVEQMIPK
jgi:hypothetical protein